MKITPKQMFFAGLLAFFGFAKPQVFASDIKLYIATDKETYSPAERVRFQVLLMNPAPGTNHSAFVELFDCRGIRQIKKMFPFLDNVSSGDIELPANVTGEFYVLYCYVINKDSVQSSCTKKIWITGHTGKQEQKLSVTAFYEGGTFIAESPNNILIKCTEEYFDTLIVHQGKIIDDKNQVYAVFKTNKQGYAKTKMNPENKVQYYISVRDRAGKENKVPLQMAMPSGITLNAEITGSNIVYDLISYSAAGAKLPDYKIEALSNGQLVYDADINFVSGLSTIKQDLNSKDLPAGFIVLRIVDKAAKVYAQRVIYNPNNNASENFISIIDTVSKKKIRVDLPAYINGKASINVIAGIINSHTDEGIILLENMEENSISFNDQLIAAPDAPGTFYPVDENSNNYLSLSGILQDKEKKPLKNKSVTLLLLYKNLKKQFLSAKTDDRGKLRIDNLVFYDSVTVYYQLADKSAEKNDVFLDLEVTPSPNDPIYGAKPFHFICANPVSPSADETKIQIDEKTLKPVVVSVEKEKTESEKFTENYTSGQFRKSNALMNEFDFIKNPPPNEDIMLFDYLKGRIAGIRIRTSVYGTPALIGSSGGTVGVYLNDMELDSSNLSVLASLPLREITQIRYYSTSFKPKVVWRDMLSDLRAPDAGDLLVYTKRNYITDEKTKGLPKTVITGYNQEKPVVSSLHQQVSQGSLYWQAGWDAGVKQTIYVGLPAGKASIMQLVIEGINNLMAPYRFTRDIVFN